VIIHTKLSGKGGVVSNQKDQHQFTYDGILHNASQEIVYNTCCKNLVNSAFQGYNGLFYN
jgi:kinesin family protein 6/9